MEWFWSFTLCSILITLPVFLWRRMRNSGSKLPPGPRGWPIIGNIFDVGTLPHRSLAVLKQKYGPIVWLSLGSLNTMAIISANAAEELFKNHDLSFIERTVVETTRSHDYYKSSIGVGSYGPYVRALRLICTVEMFSRKKINETACIRQKCLNDMCSWIEKQVDCSEGGIEVRKFVFSAVFNMIGNMILSRDLVDPNSEMALEFSAAITGIMECVGSPNVSDLFPWLRWLDLQGLRRRMDRILAKLLEITSRMVKERLKEGGPQKKDFLDMLLDFEVANEKDEPAKLSEFQISIFLVEMFVGGTETISTSIEWAMTELFRNPNEMIKIKAELARLVGTNKKFEDRDIDNLHYLQATVQETLRLHPPTPLLLSRKAVRTTNFMGYNIPTNTQVFVNAWAIGRDPECWDDPLSFKPQRFLDSNIGYKGQHFEFIPFGAGRRICPGIQLAHRVLPLILGTLLDHFDWELPNDVTSKTVDMTETMGLTARKLKPLKAIPKRSMYGLN